MQSLAEPEETMLMATKSEKAMLFQEIPSVYGASKYEQKVTDAPSSVSLITSLDIKKNTAIEHLPTFCAVLSGASR